MHLSDLPGHGRVRAQEQILLHEGSGEIPALRTRVMGNEDGLIFSLVAV